MIITVLLSSMGNFQTECYLWSISHNFGGDLLAFNIMGTQLEVIDHNDYTYFPDAAWNDSSSYKSSV